MYRSELSCHGALHQTKQVRDVTDALTAWTEAAVENLREKWAGEEDEEAARSPGDPGVQARLQLERDAITSEVGSLESFQER